MSIFVTIYNYDDKLFIVYGQNSEQLLEANQGKIMILQTEWQKCEIYFELENKI